MGLLDRKKLLEKEKLEVEKVDLTKDEFIYVRQMTGAERDMFERSLYVVDKDNKVSTRLENFRAKLAVCTVCDEKGTLLLLPEDVNTLSRSMSAAKLEKIVNAAQKLNKITEKDKEGLIKNSLVGPADNFSSDSVSN